MSEIPTHLAHSRLGRILEICILESNAKILVVGISADFGIVVILFLFLTFVVVDRLFVWHLDHFHCV